MLKGFFFMSMIVLIIKAFRPSSLISPPRRKALENLSKTESCISFKNGFRDCMSLNMVDKKVQIKNDNSPKKNVLLVMLSNVIGKMKITGLFIVLLYIKTYNKMLGMKKYVIDKLSSKKSKTNELLVYLINKIFDGRLWFRIGTLVLLSYVFSSFLVLGRPKITEISYAQFLKLLDLYPEKIRQLKISPNEIMFGLEGMNIMTRSVALEPSLKNKLLESNIDFYAAAPKTNYLGLIWSAVYAFFLYNVATKMMQGPPDPGAGKRKDKLMENMNLSFDDIAGQDQAKLEVSEVCEMLRNPSKFSSVGARLPSGVLLVGPPGTGKTLLARVTAAEAKVPFYSCSASDFVEVFVGRGPARVRKLFEQAAKNAPSIIFIDELDSIGRSRRAGFGNPEQESTLNQILTCMDGLDTSNNGVIVMSATNRYELLDPALLRAGRFDRIVQCPLPDKKGREAILSVHAGKLTLAKDVDLEKIARLTPGSCGADLCAICNEAAIRTARRSGYEVTAQDFDDALNTFAAGRGIKLSAITEGLTSQVGEWVKQVGFQPAL